MCVCWYNLRARIQTNNIKKRRSFKFLNKNKSKKELFKRETGKNKQIDMLLFGQTVMTF